MPADEAAALRSWLREHAIRLQGLDPAAPLDDLEPLRDLIAEARVVSIGENSHYVAEFGLLRHRLLRFLVERCGFTAFAFESGFSEGFALDAWVRGEGTDDDLASLAERCLPSGLGRPSEVREMLRWLRAHDLGDGSRVRYLGVDVPSAAGSLLPALEPVREYVAEADPAALELVDGALAIAADTAGTTMAKAAPRYLELGPDRQDALAAGLSRLADRFDALAPRFVDTTGTARFDVARWRIEAARTADNQLRGVAAAYTGEALPAASSSRDRFMAATVGWWLDRLDPGTRIVLAAHNAHIQRTPVVYEGELLSLPMGLHLGRLLGAGYVAIGVTSGGGRTAALQPDADAEPYGFVVDDTELSRPEPGSIEAAFEDASTGLAVADLGAAPGAAGASVPDRVRMDSGYIETPVLQAFDAIVHIPRSSLADDLGF